MTGNGLARAFVDALAGPDAAAIRRLLAPTARFWINIGPTEHSAEERLALLASEREHLQSVTFEDVRVQDTDAGFVAQLVTVATTTEGTTLRIPVCLVVTTHKDLITRVDEYADSASAAELIRLVFANDRS